MSQVALFLVAKGFAVGDEELKVARVRLINVRIINLVDNAVTEREPEPATGVIGRANAFFGAGSPARLDARRAKRGVLIAVRHFNDYCIAALRLWKSRIYHCGPRTSSIRVEAFSV